MISLQQAQLLPLETNVGDLMEHSGWSLQEGASA